jgi:hypothetical protein
MLGRGGAAAVRDGGGAYLELGLLSFGRDRRLRARVPWPAGVSRHLQQNKGVRVRFTMGRSCQSRNRIFYI